MNTSLTAYELIKRLSQLDPTTVIHWSEYDDFALGDGTTVWSVGGVTDSGYLLAGEILDNDILLDSTEEENK